MVAEFAKCYNMSIPEIYHMPSQMFFIYYEKIEALVAQGMLYGIQQGNITNTQVYGDDKAQRSVKKQVKDLNRLAKGNKP